MDKDLFIISHVLFHFSFMKRTEYPRRSKRFLNQMNGVMSSPFVFSVNGVRDTVYVHVLRR